MRWPRAPARAEPRRHDRIHAPCIDLLVEPSAANAQRWVSALSRLPDGAAAELNASADVFSGDHRYAIRINDEITVDVMPSAAGCSWEELKPHINNVVIDEQCIRVLDLQGLLKTKRGSRPKDQLDAQVLEAALKAQGKA